MTKAIVVDAIHEIEAVTVLIAMDISMKLRVATNDLVVSAILEGVKGNFLVLSSSTINRGLLSAAEKVCVTLDKAKTRLTFVWSTFEVRLF